MPKVFEIIGKKILIIGPNGSGKTTLGRKLAERTGLPFYELDFYSWQPNWVETDYPEFRKITDELTSKDEWIIDGNYARNQDITVPRAETIIWLDVSHWTSIYRTFKRSFIRSFTKEELWHGNRESLRMLFGRNSIMKYAFWHFKVKRNRYTHYMYEKFTDKNWIRIRNRKDEKEFWESLK